jgi:3-dehydroquinate dehydratase-2
MRRPGVSTADMVGFWMAKTIYVLNVPNLNLLGTREPEANGQATLSDVEKLCVETAQRYGLCTDCRHCSHVDELIEFIHEARTKSAVGIVVNAGGHCHTSAALHNALVAAKIPAIEVHVSNVGAGDNFRHHSFTAQAAFASLCGFGIDGFRLAISGLAAKIGAQAAA